MYRFLYPCIALLATCSAVSAQTYTVIHDFKSQAGDPGGPRLYGTIAQGRGGDMLTTAGSKAFRISTSGSLQVLHHFVNGLPFSGLTLARSGMFFGNTRGGGTFGAGTVFKMSSAGTVNTLYNFTGGSDGYAPHAAPIQSAEGDFYGTTQGNASPGTPPYGSVYRITEDGNFTLLHTFVGSDGAFAAAPLIQGTDFRFYGTASYGGPANDGTIFRVSSTGDFQVLVNFNGTNGSYPSQLIQANDGNFYGVTLFGGATGHGVLFRMTPGGTLTVLHNFTDGSDGSKPVELLQGSDGKLYGVTWSGGAYGSGVIFRATLSGDVTPLHNFDYATGNFPSVLFQHTNGKLYGDTYQGGTTGRGVFFSLDAGLPPFVTYLPTYGRPGAEVQILSQGFTSTTQVFFNGTLASSTIAHSTFLKATVPAGATTGPITVTTSDGTLTSDRVFSVH